jgi:hypothetical protein
MCIVGGGVKLGSSVPQYFSHNFVVKLFGKHIDAVELYVMTKYCKLEIME